MRTGAFVVAVWTGIALGLAPDARAETESEAVAARLATLEREVAILKRQLEVKNEADAARLRDAPVIGAGKDGFFIQSVDKKFQLRLRGYAQADSRWFAESEDVSNDTFLLRRIRPYVEGTDS